MEYLFWKRDAANFVPLIYELINFLKNSFCMYIHSFFKNGNRSSCAQERSALSAGNRVDKDLFSKTAYWASLIQTFSAYSRILFSRDCLQFSKNCFFFFSSFPNGYFLNAYNFHSSGLLLLNCSKYLMWMIVMRIL